MYKTLLVSTILAAPALMAATPEFHKDIEPLLQAHCQSCHRPGEIGPMPLLSYENVRPYAKAIRQAVVSKKMPPFHADNKVQHYSNDISLSAAQIDTIREWVDAGSPEGDKQLAPPARTFTDGWNIGKPDMVIEMPAAYEIPARGSIEYTYIIIPNPLKEDRWVSALEVRPEDRAHVHHIVLYERQAGSKWLGEYPKGVPFVPAPRPGTKQRSSDGDRTAEGSIADQWLIGYAPGAGASQLPAGTAFRIKAGSDFVLQLHYTTNGTASSDRSKIGLVFSKTPPAKRAFVVNVGSNDFVIPPGAANYSAKATVTLNADATMLNAQPHMHVRGKAMNLKAVYPSGETATIFDVPNYDFNWQITYVLEKPMTLPKGTKLEAVGTWDNSANNRFNPDPKSEVRWGDQTWEEMLLAVSTVQIDTNVDIAQLIPPPARRVRPGEQPPQPQR